MRQYTPLIWLTIAFMLLVACTPQPQTLPTLIPTSTVVVTDEAPQQTATTEPTRRVPPTFPPTWTPAGSVVETPLPTATEASNTVQILQPTALDVCNTLGEDIDRNTRTFPLGAAPVVAWTGVQGAGTYHISLVVVDMATPDAQPNETFADFTSDTTYTFPPELFEAGKFYGWEVYPVDAVGQQMCQSVGAELVPTTS
jgi:hypothetical protein